VGRRVYGVKVGRENVCFYVYVRARGNGDWIRGADSCGNELSSSIKSSEFLDNLRHH
jgi:hypothetical protein